MNYELRIMSVASASILHNPVHRFVVLRSFFSVSTARDFSLTILTLQKGGVPAAPSGTATLLRLSPSY